MFSWLVSATDWGWEAVVGNPFIGARNSRSDHLFNLHSRGSGNSGDEGEEFHVKFINYNK